MNIARKKRNRQTIHRRQRRSRRNRRRKTKSWRRNVPPLAWDARLLVLDDDEFGHVIDGGVRERQLEGYGW